MAIDTEEEVRRRVAEVAPGARVTSGRRSVAHNREVGGVPNSLHTREGEDGGSRALDWTPGTSGLSMAELSRRIGNSGLHLQERLNEGDHVHTGFDGRPAGERRAPQVLTDDDGKQYTVAHSDALAPEDTPESLAAAGYSQDRDGTWFRMLAAPDMPQPLDASYARRQEDRESLALDQEELHLIQAAMIPEPVVRAAGAVAADVGKGVFLEGAQAIGSGIGRGINASLDLVDETADWIEKHIPGTVMWEGFDGDASTPMRISLTTQDRAQARIEEKQGSPSFLQRLGMAQARIPSPEEGRPESNTGRVIEGVSQFATGWATGGRALRGWKVARGASTVGRALAQGAIADFTAFDGNEARLSNILADVSPRAIAPVFDYLAANEDDPELLGRAKNMIEGGLAGMAVDVLFRGIRGLRGARQAREQIRAEASAEGLQIDPTLHVDEAAAQGEELADAVRSSLGNPAGPRFRVRPVAEAPVIVPFETKIEANMAATSRVGPADFSASTANVFDINLARIESSEDVRAVITGMADRMAKDVDLARRGQRSWDETRAASGRVDWVESMAARQPGGAVNAETALAYRHALNSSAESLLKLAREVETNPTLANQYAFRRATSVHSAIQNELMGARAEAGRALNAFRIPAGAPATYLRQVDSLIADMGGANTAQEMARRIRQAAEKGDVALNQMVRGGVMARTTNAMKLIYTNGLLSGVGTPIINTVGNAAMLGLNVAARTVAPRLARAFGGNASTQIGEAGALLHGYQQAFRDVFRLNPLEAATRIAGDDGRMLPTALRENGLYRGMAPGLEDAAPDGIKLRAEREEAGSGGSGALSAGAWRVNEDTPLGRTLDIINMMVDSPSNWNALTDDFFKVVTARGELHAQAFRQVVGEGLEGEAARTRLAGLMESPTDDMLKAAEQEMHDLTFTRDIGPRQFEGEAEGASRTIGQSLMDMRSSMDSWGGPYGTIALPFIKTPANLISTGLRYSPLARWSRRFRNDIAAGGARAETAKAQVAIGTALWSVWMGMAMDGQMTGRGPGNRGQKEALMRADESGAVNWQPYSVRLGERWYSYERADPLGQGMSLVSDMAELMKNTDWDNDPEGAALSGNSDEIAAHIVMALGQAFFDKTMLKSAGEITAVLAGGTDADAERLAMQRLSGSLPFSSASRMVRRAEDPYMRETHSVMTALMNTMPGFSDDLPPQRDLWGRERTYQTGLGAVYDAMVPVQTRAAGGSAVDLQILDNGVSVTMPNRSISVMGETVSLKNRPDIYSEFVRLAGEPAYEHLNEVVTGNHADSEYYFSLADGPGGGVEDSKGDYIKDVIRQYREDARLLIVDQFASDLQGMAARRIEQRESRAE